MTCTKMITYNNLVFLVQKKIAFQMFFFFLPHMEPKKFKITKVLPPSCFLFPLENTNSSKNKSPNNQSTSPLHSLDLQCFSMDDKFENLLLIYSTAITILLENLSYLWYSFITKFLCFPCAGLYLLHDWLTNYQR